MLLPVGDTPNPKDYRPWCNWLLIATNIAVYLFISFPLSTKGVDPYDPALQEYLRFIAPHLPRAISLPQLLRHISSYDLFIFSHGYKAGAPQLGDLFFSLFLHGGFLHLAGNMLFLWIYGDNVEHRLGHIVYLLVYLSCGVAATLFFAFFTSTSMTPLVGASGAISGVLGLYFLFFPRNRIKVFFFFFPFFMDTFLLPARLVLGFYLLVDNLLPFLLSNHGGGVAHGAHIGGFLAGLLFAWGYHQFQVRPDKLGRQKRHHPDFQSPDPPLERLRQALKTGNRSDAFKALHELEFSALQILDPRETVRLAGWLREAGHQRSADHLLRHYLKTHPNSPGLAPMYLNLGEARIRQNQAPSAFQYLLDGLDHHPDPETERALHRALQEVDGYWKK